MYKRPICVPHVIPEENEEWHENLVNFLACINKEKEKFISDRNEFYTRIELWKTSTPEEQERLADQLLQESNLLQERFDKLEKDFALHEYMQKQYDTAIQRQQKCNGPKPV